MTEEVKKRIEDINNGIVPEGYKKTRTGIFPADWDEVVIEELFYKVMERNNGQFDKTKWISVAKMYYQEPEKVTSNNIDTRTYVMRKGDMAFEGHPNKDFLFGRFVVNDIGDGIISELFPIYRHKDEYVSEYWKYAIQYESVMARIYSRCITISGASANKINDDEFLKEKLCVPSLNEQKTIGRILLAQDELITIQERKVEELKNLKRAYLTKMFPQKGNKYPEIRFKRFTDAWEQRKLGDQMYIKARIGWQALTKSEYLQTGDYYLITGTDIDEDTHTVDLKRCFYVSKERYDMDDKIQVHEGDIIVTKDGTIGKVAMVTGLDKPATLNSHLFVLRDLSGNLDNYYLLTVLNSHIFNQFVEATKTGSTLTGLPQKTFVEFTFPVPSLEEQKQISGFFKNLDNTITLHQRKLEAEKKKKKALMQLLLTGKVRVKV